MTTKESASGWLPCCPLNTPRLPLWTPNKTNNQKSKGITLEERKRDNERRAGKGGTFSQSAGSIFSICYDGVADTSVSVDFDLSTVFVRPSFSAISLGQIEFFL